MRKKKERHSISNFADFQSPIKTSIMDILTRGFCAIRSCVPTKNACMDGNNVKTDDENG